MNITSPQCHTYCFNSDSANTTPNSTVYIGCDTVYNRDVIIKTIDLSDCFGRDLEKKIEFAKNETQAMLSLSDNIYRIPCIFDYFYDTPSKKFCIVMQLIKGKTLREELNTAPPLFFLTWIIELCDIVGLMNKSYLLHHKDIKPENIMISSDRTVYLIDFNLSISSPNLNDGTANYKAPEMWNNKTNDFSKSDMFSLGVIMYEYYTKHLPIANVDYGQKVSRFFKSSDENKWTVFTEPEKFKPDIRKDISEIIIKCMKFDPKDRYSSYNELKTALKKARGGKF